MTSRGGLGSKSRGTLGNSRDTRPIETEEIKVGQSTSEQTIIKKGDITSVGGTATLNNLVVSGTATFNTSINATTEQYAAGGTADASEHYNTDYVPSKAFDRDTNSTYGWWTGQNISPPVWISYEYPTDEKIVSYKIWTLNQPNWAYFVPHDWELRGAASSTAYSGGTYTVVDSRSGITDGWVRAVGDSFTDDTYRKAFTCSNPGNYKYYVLHITVANDNYYGVAMRELAFYKSITKFGNMLIGTGEESTSGFVGIESGNENYYGLFIGNTGDIEIEPKNKLVINSYGTGTYQDGVVFEQNDQLCMKYFYGSDTLVHLQIANQMGVKGGYHGAYGIAVWALPIYSQLGYAGGSDDRIKFNEQPITNALDIINKLKLLSYEKLGESTKDEKIWIPTDAEWNSVKDSLDSEGKRIYNYRQELGFIAQDVRTIPELSHTVSGTGFDEQERQMPLGLDYTQLFCVACQAVQELDEQLQAEKAKVATLETTVADLVARITALENA